MIRTLLALFACRHRAVIYDRTNDGRPCWRCWFCGCVKERTI